MWFASASIAPGNVLGERQASPDDSVTLALTGE